jgi:hypothetical protein
MTSSKKKESLMTTSLLNLNQSPDELNRVHGEMDYYWYLSSKAFVDAFLQPMAKIIDRLDDPCLDVGCGEAVLADLVNVPYAGFDGSESAVSKALVRNPRLQVMVGRIEFPPDHPFFQRDFGTVVFGGLLSVLIKPAAYADFFRLYRDRFKVKHFIVYDLDRVDLLPIGPGYTLIERFSTRADLPNAEPRIVLDRTVTVLKCN